MTCNACGDKPKKTCDGFTKAVIEINNPETLVLLRKVVIPASMGTEEDVPAAIGKYHNVILHYEANKHTYLYSSDGIPTLLEMEIPQEVLDRITELEEGLVDESETRADADTALGTRIDGVASDLVTETSNRESADATLQSNITAEATARANADATLQTNIDNLSTALTTETTNRTNADTALGTRIDGVAGDLATETTNRQTADTNLQTAISNEATARANADTSLQTALNTETTARQTADTGLQSQIDAIVASSDVKDIVGTYAALQQYDTSTLGDNDVIKVLQDETHSDETTYYRWSTATGTFTLIGEEGPYYTKSATDTLLNAKADKATTYTKTEVDTALAAKQDNLIAGTNISIASDGKTISATDTTYTAGTGLNLTGTQFSVNTSTIATQSDLTTGLATKQNALTAGSNVQISNDTISATDTTYSPFTGTDGTTAGTSGLVPAPATTDAGKVLGADGTWVTGGPTVVQTTGTSTTDVMSQNATTSIVFADPETRNRIVIGKNAASRSDSGYCPIAIGEKAVAGRANYVVNNGIAIGNEANVTGIDAISIGAKATTPNSRYSVAIGANTVANASSGGAVAIGGGDGANAAKAGGDYSVAIGYKAQMLTVGGQDGQIALGSFSYPTKTGQMDISLFGGTASQRSANGYNGSAYRLLTGLYDPQSAHDAATKGYVDPSTDTAAPTTSTTGRLGEIRIDTSTNTAYMCVSADSTTSTFIWKQITA